MEAPQTWHYGVVAQWWAERNLDGPEIDYYRAHIERHGQPALDVACGTGRLLVPYLRAGLDVDGCDVSPDMLAWCAARAEREGLTARLYLQAMHELDLPRRYRTIIVCGAFGLGGSRTWDEEALRRIRAHLEPGGVLVMDYRAEDDGEEEWRRWLAKKGPSLPEPAAAPELHPSVEGGEIGIRSRIVAVDPQARVVTREMRAQRWRDGRLEADETHTLRVCVYFRDELLGMLATYRHFIRSTNFRVTMRDEWRTQRAHAASVSRIDQIAASRCILRSAGASRVPPCHPRRFPLVPRPSRPAACPSCRKEQF